jgi:hypothetical protein
VQLCKAVDDMSTDPDAPAVIELLRGVAGDARDPDVEIAELLVTLANQGHADVDSTLELLIRHAHRD